MFRTYTEECKEQENRGVKGRMNTFKYVKNFTVT